MRRYADYAIVAFAAIVALAAFIGGAVMAAQCVSHPLSSVCQSILHTPAVRP
jgi:hypothetical protein